MSNRHIYSDEEPQQLFQNLAFEKDKANELEKELQNVKLEQTMLLSENDPLKPSSNLSYKRKESVDNLKNMLARYKKKNVLSSPVADENVHQRNKQESNLAYQLHLHNKKLTQENIALLEQQKSLKALYDQLAADLKEAQQKEENDQAVLHKSSELADSYQEALLQNQQQKEQLEKLTLVVQEQEKKIHELMQEEPTHDRRQEDMLGTETKLEQEPKNIHALKMENHALAKKLAEIQKHSTQLERVLKHLHERSKEAYLELNQLREDFQRSEEAVFNLTGQLEVAQKRIHQQIEALNNEKAEKQELVEEIHALQLQFSSLKTKLAEEREAFNKIKDEKMHLETSMTEKDQLFNQLEKEIIFIKEDLSKGMREAKEIESCYMNAVSEKIALYNKVLQGEETIASQQNENKALQCKLEQISTKENDFKEQLLRLENLLHEQQLEAERQKQQHSQELESSLQQQQDLFKLKEQQVEADQKEITYLSQEKFRLEDTLSIMTRYQEEQDARIKVAQQHLGKKVKEVALLNEKIEEQKSLIADLEENLNQLKIKMNERQNSFEQQLMQESKTQHLLQETIRATESQVAQWEAKYQQAEENLKTLEEKQQQMHSLLASLSHVIGAQDIISQGELSGGTVTPKRPLEWEEASAQISLNDEHSSLPDEQLESQPSLFDARPASSPLRQNLFD
ncbi:Uncharacterized protein NEOC65_001364 [Neochlamydia sp. AcF65]|uniref:hypothetical protein n=1 Tax=Neochlamydia sp. AcF65 TaxID=2795735 RepID=UPI001BC8FAAE|nr:hypothetical protein [Neochlamydia sp. AcF65]MBS4166279.1 Uncharacterized protein [Neochlamydia sp. AcF65]